VGLGLEPSPGVCFGDIPPLFHLYPACTSPYPWYPVYPCIDLYLAIVQQIYWIPLYPTVSSYFRTYLAVYSCIPLYLTLSHRLKKTGYGQNYTPGRGLVRVNPTDLQACPLSPGWVNIVESQTPESQCFVEESTGHNELCRFSSKRLEEK